MLRLLLVILVGGALVASIVFVRPKRAFSAAIPAKAPAVHFAAAESNLGFLDIARQNTFSLTVFNDGPRDFAVESVKPSCSCTSALDNVRTIPAKGKADLQFVLNHKDSYGLFSVNIAVSGTAGSEPLATATHVVGWNKPPGGLLISPDHIAFGTLRPDKVPTRRVEVTGTKNLIDTLQIVQEDALHAVRGETTEHLYNIDTLTRATFEVAPKPKEGAYLNEGSLSLAAGVEKATISATWRRNNKLLISPTRQYLGIIPRNRPVEFPVQIAEKAPVEFVTDDPAITVAPGGQEVGEARIYQIKVLADDHFQSGVHSEGFEVVRADNREQIGRVEVDFAVE